MLREETFAGGSGVMAGGGTSHSEAHWQGRGESLGPVLCPASPTVCSLKPPVRWSDEQTVVRLGMTGSGAVVAHLLWEQEVGGSSPPSPTQLCCRGRRAASPIVEGHDHDAVHVADLRRERRDPRVRGLPGGRPGALGRRDDDPEHPLARQPALESSSGRGVGLSDPHLLYEREPPRSTGRRVTPPGCGRAPIRRPPRPGWSPARRSPR